MQAFFSNFFQRPSHPVWNALRLGMVSLLRTRPALQLLATRGPWAAKTKHDGPPQPTARFRSVAPNRSGVYSRTEDRAASTRRQHIPGHRTKDTPDSPLLFLAAR